MTEPLPGQMSIFELPGLYRPPELWECMKTCIHAGGPWDDHFPGRPDIPRCRYPDQVPGMNNGGNMKQKVVNNHVHIWCTLYERGEADGASHKKTR